MFDLSLVSRVIAEWANSVEINLDLSGYNILHVVRSNYSIIVTATALSILFHLCVHRCTYKYPKKCLLNLYLLRLHFEYSVVFLYFLYLIPMQCLYIYLMTWKSNICKGGVISIAILCVLGVCGRLCNPSYWECGI